MQIYVITNTINDKKYIGQTRCGLKARWRAHKYNALTRKENTYLYNSIRKYGIEYFTMDEIDTADNLEKLNKLESHYIKKFNTMTLGYNLTSGGDACIMSMQTRSNISASIKEYYKNNPISEEQRKEMSKRGKIAWQQNKRSESENSEISKRMLVWWKTNPLNDEDRNRRSLAAKKYYKDHPISVKQRLLMKENSAAYYKKYPNTYGNNPAAIRLCVTNMSGDKQLFNSQKELCEAYNTTPWVVRRIRLLSEKDGHYFHEKLLIRVIG